MHAPALTQVMHRLWLAAAVCLMQAAAAPAWAQDVAGQRESSIKAAFLYKFAGFVEWPAAAAPRANEPLVIGILGNEAVAGDLEQMVAGRSFEGRPIVTQRLREGEALNGVHVLLVGAMREARLREVLAAVPGAVLVVTEQENGLRLGGVLNFSADGGRIRFSASLASAAARGLQLSARLLNVAQSVEGRP